MVGSRTRSRERDEVRVDVARAVPRLVAAVTAPDLDLRVSEQQPDDLSSGVAARARDCCPDHDA